MRERRRELAVWHTVFIVLHAVAATVAWLSGLAALPSGRWYGIHRWSLLAMAAALVPALALGWPDYDPVTRVAFTGLLGLACVMLLRAEQARRILPATTGGPTARYVDAVGFTLISLSDGFAIVAAVRAGMPSWAVAVIAVGVVVLGQFGLHAAKARLVRPTSAGTPAAR